MIRESAAHHSSPATQHATVVTSMCGICPSGCGVNVHLVDGKIDRLTPIKGHPAGIVCPRGLRAKEIVYSPDRILYPQKRIGERGEKLSQRGVQRRAQGRDAIHRGGRLPTLQLPDIGSMESGARGELLLRQPSLAMPELAKALADGPVKSCGCLIH